MKQQKTKKVPRKPPRASSEPSEIDFYEEKIYREINSESFGQSLAILVHHYKKKTEKALQK